MHPGTSGFDFILEGVKEVAGTKLADIVMMSIASRQRTPDNLEDRLAWDQLKYYALECMRTLMIGMYRWTKLSNGEKQRYWLQGVELALFQHADKYPWRKEWPYKRIITNWKDDTYVKLGLGLPELDPRFQGNNYNPFIG